MLSNLRIDSRLKTVAIAGLMSVSMAACGGAGTSDGSSSNGASTYEVAGDHTLGSADAPVTIVEYASLTCAACANWHTTVFPDLKEKYVDTGKVRYVYRPFPTGEINLARSGFLLADCADEAKFFDNIMLQFQRQMNIMQAPRAEYIKIAKAAGLSETEFESCILDDEAHKRYDAFVKLGQDSGVSSTPSFVIDGENIERVGGQQLFTIETFDEVLAPMLGEDAPKASAEPEKDLEPTE